MMMSHRHLLVQCAKREGTSRSGTAATIAGGGVSGVYLRRMAPALLPNGDLLSCSTSSTTRSSSSCSSSLLLVQQKQPRQMQVLRQQQQQQHQYQCRWKHSRSSKGAKVGQKLDTLKEMAHDNERQTAAERRQKKKHPKHSKVEEEDPDKDEEEYDDDDHDDTNADDDHNSLLLLPDMNVVKGRMEQHVLKFKEYCHTVRGAEPTIDMFDGVTVNAYGDANTPLVAVAQVVLNSPTLATATCFDPSLTKAVATAIQNQLELNPSTNGENNEVKIPIPRMSLETRNETASMVKQRAEGVRQRIRSVRRKAVHTTKLGMAGKIEHVSKDEAYDLQQEIEQVTEKMIAQINTIVENKLQQIMAV